MRKKSETCKEPWGFAEVFHKHVPFCSRSRLCRNTVGSAQPDGLVLPSPRAFEPSTGVWLVIQGVSVYQTQQSMPFAELNPSCCHISRSAGGCFTQRSPKKHCNDPSSARVTTHRLTKPKRNCPCTDRSFWETVSPCLFCPDQLSSDVISDAM